MKSIVISLITEEEKNGFNYLGVEAKLKILDLGCLLESADEQEIITFIGSFNSDSEGLIFTFLAHGGFNGLSDNAGGGVQYQSLLSALSASRTLHPVYVNLLANCNSVNSLNFLPDDNLISEIWYTISKTESINLSLLAMQQGSFESFINCFFEGADHYRRWTN